MKLFTELVNTIYPIEPSSASTLLPSQGSGDGSGEGQSSEFMIRGIELPMVIDTRYTQPFSEIVYYKLMVTLIA